MDGYLGRALVVDDEQAIREICRTILEQIGYAVDVAEDGRLALHTLERGQPVDLLLLDLHMPGMGGIELLQAVREHGYATSAIVMTGNPSVENANEVQRLGALAMLLKPFPLSQLRSLAREVLAQRDSHPVQQPLPTPHPLIELSQRLAGQLDFPQLCKQVVRTAQESLAAEQVLLIGDGTVVCQAHQRPTAAIFWQPLAEWVATYRRPLVLNADTQLPAELVALPLKPQQQVVCVPLGAGWRQHGALLAERLGLAFSPVQVEMLMMIGSLSAVALENAELHSAVARSESRYRALLEHAAEAVLLLDGEATIVLEANAAVSAISGYTRTEVLALAPQQLIPALTHESATEIETTLLTHTGQAVPVAVGISTISHEGGAYKLLIVRDISERTRLARQSIQAEKLAGMGRLSASLAHEINNPLQALQSSLSLLVERAMPEEKRTQIIHMAHGQVGQLVGVVQHMMDLYRPTVREGMRPISPHELLETVIANLLPRLHQHQIAIERDWASQLPRIRGVSSQLKQVLNSLMLHAIEASPEGGTLNIRTLTATMQQRAWVQIIVSDNGGGLAPHEIHRLFEPFATGAAERTGLSLAVSYNIVEQHEGRLTVESSERGTIFTISLPALL